MNKHTTPKWVICADWGVGGDSYNFILYRKTGERWNANSYYPSIESLLQSLYDKLTRTEPADPDLVRHVEAVSERVEACATALFAKIEAMGDKDKKPCQPPSAINLVKVAIGAGGEK